MTSHELMIKTNHHLIKGGLLTKAQKTNIAAQFLAAVSDEKTRQNFLRGVKAPEYLFSEGQSNDSRKMYPLFYIPPYNDGKKLQTVVPMSPKTHILSANAHELEIIRLLHLFSPDDPAVADMVEKTLVRLKTTCFGYNDCHIGECFHTSLVVLRFLAATRPDNAEWLGRLCRLYQNHSGDTRRHSGVAWYYWLCLAELPADTAKPEILKYKSCMLQWLTSKSAVMNSEQDKINHPVLFCIIRNCLCRFEEYEHIKTRQPYTSEKDGRLHFDMI